MKLLGVTLGMAGWALAQEPPTIRVPVRLVSVPTVVFSGDGSLIPDLQASSFRVLDNGAAQAFRVEANAAAVSVAVAVQANLDVRSYAGFIAKAGSVIDTLLAGASGEVAVLAYGDDVSVVQPFGREETGTAFRKIRANGKSARMVDAGLEGVRMLAERPAARSRVLLFVGQPIDSGSEARFEALRERAEKENVAVFGLSLPLVGRAFISDTFWLRGVSQAEKGGIRAGADLGRLGAVIGAKAREDPWAALSMVTGGSQLFFRTQRQLEDGIAAIGLQLRSAYLLSYYPAPAESGYHAIRVEVNVPGAKVSARQGYWLGAH